MRRTVTAKLDWHLPTWSMTASRITAVTGRNMLKPIPLSRSNRNKGFRGETFLWLGLVYDMNSQRPPDT